MKISARATKKQELEAPTIAGIRRFVEVKV
jgi:hypothetical protein